MDEYFGRSRSANWWVSEGRRRTGLLVDESAGEASGRVCERVGAVGGV